MPDQFVGAAGGVDLAVRPARVAVIDDHRLLAQMLADELGTRGYDACSVDVLESSLATRIRELAPDLVLLDAVFHDDEDAGMRVLQELRSDGTDPVVVILTGVTDDLRHAEFLDAGAETVITKGDTIDVVVAQVEDVLTGVDPLGANRRSDLAHRLRQHRAEQEARTAPLRCLTDREHATLQALVDGLTVDEIAHRRTVARSTVRSQVRAVLRKLGVSGQIEAVAFAARHGFTPRDHPEP